MRAEKNTYQSRGEYQSEPRRIPIRAEENPNQSRGEYQSEQRRIPIRAEENTNQRRGEYSNAQELQYPGKRIQSSEIGVMHKYYDILERRTQSSEMGVIWIRPKI